MCKDKILQNCCICARIVTLLICGWFISCSVYHMMEIGCVKVSSTDVKDLHYQYQKEKAEEKAEPGSFYTGHPYWEFITLLGK